MKSIFASALPAPKWRAWFLLFPLLWAKPAAATDNYSYRAGEYAVISGGRSPDGRWSIAAHGGGEYGYDDFDLYLMREPAHEMLAPLGIRDRLDTAPLSIAGLWAKDSKHVAVLNRGDRHILDLSLFAVSHGRAQSIAVPALAGPVSQRHVKPGVRKELIARFYRVTWQKPDRLALEEYNAFKKLYLNADHLGSQRDVTDFSAKAVCEITGKGRVRLLDLKPLPNWPNWPKRIVYSPHLLYERDRGLHSTETTMSSIAAQEGRK